MHAVLHDDHALGTSRGKRFEYRDGELVVPVIVTYHPAYLLRNLPDKAKAWEDLCFARRTMREQQAAGMGLPLQAG
jgi:DNA polymerase